MVFASVSKDNSARIWHLRKKSALIVLGGQKGHLDQVLSCVSQSMLICSFRIGLPIVHFWLLVVWTILLNFGI